MAQLEIEMKAWVKDPDAVLHGLRSMGAEYLRDFHKDDRYFHLHVSNGSPRDFRVRMDGSEAWLTFKDKRLVDGLEINVEHETLLGSPEVLVNLALRLGCTEFVRKTKTGSSWRHGSLHIELSMVEGLGNFIELEEVIEAPEQDQDSRAVGARAAIMACLEALGLGRENIEERTYTSMLLARSVARNP